MKETGKVIEVKGEMAVVMIERSGKCEKCGLCSKITERQPILEVKNKEGVKEGDTVEIEIKEENLLKVSIFIYGFPLLGFILGIFFSQLFKNNFLKVFSFLSLFIFFFYFGFKKGESYSKSVKPEITGKVENGT